METRNEVKSVVNGVVEKPAVNGIEQDASAAEGEQKGLSTSSAEQKPAEKTKRRRTDFDPTLDLKRSAKRLESVQGSVDATVVADAGVVASRRSGLESVSSTLTRAQVQRATAEKTWSGVVPGLRAANAAMVAMLLKGVEGGRTFYEQCHDSDPWTMANNLVARFPADNFGLVPTALDPLKTAIQIAGPAHQQLAVATKAEADAEAAFLVARTQLSDAMATLWSSILRERVNRRHGGASSGALPPVANAPDPTGGAKAI